MLLLCDSNYEVTSFKKFEIKFIIWELNVEQYKKDISDRYIATLTVSGSRPTTVSSSQGVANSKPQRARQLKTAQNHTKKTIRTDN